MKFLKLFEQYKKPYREVDIQKLWNCINNREFMKLYFDEYKEIFNLDKIFFRELLEKMLLDKEIAFHRVVHPIDDEIHFVFEGRVKDIWIKDDPVVALYDHKQPYILAKIYNNPEIKNEQIVRIYNSEITEIEQNFEDIEIRLNAKNYNL